MTTIETAASRPIFVRDLAQQCADDMRALYGAAADEPSAFTINGFAYRVADENEFGDALATFGDGWFSAALRFNSAELLDLDEHPFRAELRDIIHGNADGSADA